MARKLGLGWGMICATALLAGCQTGTGARVATNNTIRNPALAKQSSIPNPSFPTAPATPNNGFGTATSNAFPQAPNMPSNFQTSNGGLATQNSVNPAGSTTTGSAAPPFGPRNSGTPTGAVRSTETYTQPMAPQLPPLPPQPPTLSPPGITPLPLNQP